MAGTGPRRMARFQRQLALAPVTREYKLKVCTQSEAAILATCGSTAMRLKPMGRLAASVVRRLERLHRRRPLTTGHHVDRSTSQDDWRAPLNRPHRWPQGRALAGAAVSLRCRAAQALGSARVRTRFVI